MDWGECGRDGARKGSNATRVGFDEAESDEETEEPLSAVSLSVKGRLMAGIMTGGMASVKGSKAYKPLEGMQMEDRIDRLHSEPIRNKLSYPKNDFEVQLNYTMEEYCGLEVWLVRLETLCHIGKLSTGREHSGVQEREHSL